MKNQHCTISPTTRKRLEDQGYVGFTDSQLDEFKFGIRFAYYLCALMFLTGLVLQDINILFGAMVVALLATIPPYHPFDYLYNHAIRHVLKKTKLPPRSNQGRFACGIASLWIGIIILLLKSGFDVWAYLAGGILLVVAGLVSMLDLCIPSIVYNYLFKRKVMKTPTHS
jgi:hypothetical protein